jgi:hypothetical protein
MTRLSRSFFGAIIAIAPILSYAQGPASTGTITGSADPGAQIVVTGTDSGAVIGIMAACDGTYKAEGLKLGGIRLARKVRITRLGSFPSRRAQSPMWTWARLAQIQVAPAISKTKSADPSKATYVDAEEV